MPYPLLGKARYSTPVMNFRAFAYADGRAVHAGDRICVAGHRGRVERILAPETLDAQHFDCFGTGGILLKFDNGDLQLWPWTDEDLVLMGRGGGD